MIPESEEGGERERWREELRDVKLGQPLFYFLLMRERERERFVVPLIIHSLVDS